MKKLFSTLLILVLASCLCLALSACVNEENPTLDTCEHYDSESDSICDKCGEKIFPAEHTHSLIKIDTVHATCTKNGNIEYWKCESCENLYSDANATVEILIADTVIPAAHTGGTEIRDAKAPSESAEGYTGDTYCLGCGEKLSSGEVIEKLDHTHNMVKTEAKDATCTENGNIECWTCTKCEKIYSDEKGIYEIAEEDTVIARLHAGGTEIRGVKAATEDEEGYTGDTYCLGCGEKLSSGEVIEKLDHTHNMVKTDAKDATCTENGNVEYYTCAKCKKIYSDANGVCEISKKDTVINAGHKYVDSFCSVCGKENKTDGLEYELNDDETAYTVIGIGTAADKNIIIPATYNDLPVTAIGSYAFWYESDITSVTIDKNVKNIGEAAFYECDNLIEVYIGNSVETVEPGAFGECVNLKKVHIGKNANDIAYGAFSESISLSEIIVYKDNLTYKSVDGSLYTKDGKTLLQYAVGKKDTEFTIPSSVENIAPGAFACSTNLVSISIPGSVKTIGEIAFAYSENLISITIPDSITSIGEGAFYDCDNLTGVTIGTGVTSIGERAFYDCDRLTSIAIGNNVTSIGKYAFGSCNTLININIETENTAYKSIDGNLYTKDGKTLLQYAIGKPDATFTIPDSVETIADYAFYHCANLKSCIITDSVITIGEASFCGCTSLLDISIGKNVTAIGDDAFSGCNSLAFVTIPDKVTSISQRTFMNCHSLVSITIGSGITSIGDNAFFQCLKMVEIINHSSLDLDTDTSGITNYALIVHNDKESRIVNKDGFLFYTHEGENYLVGYMGDNSTLILPDDYNGEYYKIHDFAFSNRSDINNIILSDGVTYIGNEALFGCSNLYSITIGKNVTEIESFLFDDCHRLAEIINKSNLYINTDRYLNYEQMDRVAIHEGESLIVEKDGYVFMTSESGTNYLLGYNGNDTELILPDSYNGESYVIESRAFYECDNLTSIIISDNVTEIMSYAFEGCYNLTKISIGKSVRYIGYDAFHYCSSLKEVHISDIDAWCKIDFAQSYTSYGDGSISNPLYHAKNLYLNGSPVTELIISEEITYIKPYAFYNCETITSVILNDSVTDIGKHAFKGCRNIAFNVHGNCNYLGTPNNPYKFLISVKNTSISEAIVHKDTEIIISYAFSDCPNITKVVIPFEVTVIFSNAFYNCPNITILCEAAEPHHSWFYGWNAENYPVTWGYNNLTTNSDYDYIILDDEAILTKYKGNATEITVPSMIDGYEVINFNSIFEANTTITKVIIPDTITHIAPSAFAYCTSLTGVTIGDSVTSIGEYAFADCTSLAGINIPDSVTSIGDYAFLGCSSLAGVYINDIAAWCNIDFEDAHSNPLFYPANLYLNGNLITELVIPDEVTEIKAYAFTSCTSLTGVTIGDSVTSIGEYAFEGCDSLTNVTFSDNSQLTRIGDYAFYGCSSITGINIPDSVTSIGDYAFSRCSSISNITVAENNTAYKSINGNLYTKDEKTLLLYATGKTDTEFTIPEGVETISNSAFEGCDSLTKITISNSVISIGAEAFCRCSSLAEIKIPDNVTSIGNSAFEGCSSLRKINFNATAMNDFSNYNYVFSNAGSNGDGINVTIGNNVTKIPTYLFCGSRYIVSVEFEKSSVCESIDDYAFASCPSLTCVTIGDSVTSIGDCALYDCSSLTNITFSDNSRLTRIGDSAFKYCASLTEITIPNSVTSIGANAFRFCSSITGINIPDSVTSIGDYAFEACTALTEINFNATDMNDLNIDNHVFYNAGKDGDGIKVTIGNNVTNIPAYLFYPYSKDSSCSPKIVNLEFEKESVCKSIGAQAFVGCENLNNVYITDITAWCNIDFEDAYSNPLFYPANLYLNGNLITELVIPDEVTEIKAYAFTSCTSLTSVTIGDSVTSIGEFAFEGCDSLTNVTFSDNSQTESIGEGAFAYCRSLAGINIPDSVTSIGDCALYDCSSLTNITFSDNSQTESIGYAAFAFCYSLVSINIPDSVTSIGDYAFYDCDSLTSIMFNDTSTWYSTADYTNWKNKTSGTITDVSDSLANVIYFTSIHVDCYWYKE